MASSSLMNEDAAPRPRKSRVVVPLIALAVLAVAFAGIWVAIKDDGNRVLETAAAARAPAPAAEPKKPAAAAPVPGNPAAANRPIGDDEPAFWSDVAIYKAGPHRPRPIVVVTRGKQPETAGPPSFYQGLLAREIVRQGLLLAARDELGPITRDVPIGDPVVSGKPAEAERGHCRSRKGTLVVFEEL